jgi:hypothetical protein
MPASWHGPAAHFQVLRIVKASKRLPGWQSSMLSKFLDDRAGSSREGNAPGSPEPPIPRQERHPVNDTGSGDDLVGWITVKVEGSYRPAYV